jgi:stress-induced morphogen
MSSAHAVESREQKLTRLLTDALKPKSLRVIDHAPGTSGGLVEVHVEAERFNGKRILEQHRMVTQAVQSEMDNMHALNIQTRGTE